MVSKDNLIKKLEKVKTNLRKTPIQTVFVVRSYTEHWEDIKTLEETIEVLKKCDIK